MEPTPQMWQMAKHTPSKRAVVGSNPTVDAILVKWSLNEGNLCLETFFIAWVSSFIPADGKLMIVYAYLPTRQTAMILEQ